MRGDVLDQAYIKQHNILRVLSVLERAQPLSRTDLARITDMSATSVTRIVSQLQALGLAEEQSLSPAPGRGRRAINLRTRPDGLFTAGFHGDDRNVYACLTDFSGEVRARRVADLPDTAPSPEIFAQSIGDFLNEFRAITPRIRAVGVSVSGRIDSGHGTVVHSQSLGWRDLPLGDALTKRLGLPVCIENDTHACLAREQRLRPEDDLAYLYIGRSGIGLAGSVNGGILRGHGNAAGEIEDMRLLGGQRLGECLHPASLLCRAQKCCPEVHSIKDILTARRMGIAWAEILLSDFTRNLSALVGVIDAFLDPARVILGGDVPETLAECLAGVFSEHVVPGANYEQTCAAGAADIAMRLTVASMVESLDEHTCSDIG